MFARTLNPWLLGAAALLLIASTGTAWLLGRSLIDTRADLAVRTAQLATCNDDLSAARAETKQVAEEWKAAYDQKTKEAAKAYDDLQARSKLSCKAQFNAGYEYGKAIGSVPPARSDTDRVRDPSDNFRTYWTAAP